ncbi:MAG TPA: hypothetical protein EYQ50_01025 [Verrucomicrobiales bacterium]|nr:hypothetical protein [Verrucomicrobiales bacterium]
MQFSTTRPQRGQLQGALSFLTEWQWGERPREPFMDFFIHGQEDKQECDTFLSTPFQARGDALPPIARTDAEGSLKGTSSGQF